MYHSEAHNRTALLAFALSFIIILSTGFWLDAKAGDAFGAEPSILPRTKIKHKPMDVELYRWDDASLVGRKPLLFVHGLHGEGVATFHWKKLIDTMQANKDFQNTYKIYLVRYNTQAPLAVTGPLCQKALLDLHKITGGKPVTIVALSLGGNLVQQAMMAEDVDKTVSRVMTFGTPFHGSPLFTLNWFQYSIYKNPSHLWSRLDHSVAHRLYFDRNINLTRDLKWDNADGMMPDAGSFRSRIPLGPRGDLSVAADANFALYKMNSKPLPDKSKFITYAGYLINSFNKRRATTRIESHMLMPYFFATRTVPAHLAFEHSVLKMLNTEMSRVICKQDPKAPTVRAYDLNDGISPLTSALYLPENALKTHILGDESSVKELRGATDVGLARVFRNIDHLTFVDGLHPLFTSTSLRDELNPEAGKRTIFEWILSDLLTEPGSSEVAKGSKPEQAKDQESQVPGSSNI
jgi:hypothetical protein